MLRIYCRNEPGRFFLCEQSMYTWFSGRSALEEPISAALLLMQSIHIDSGTLGGAALLHGWVKSQFALAALCGQLQYLNPLASV